MATDIFVDTSGFYALLIQGDDAHSLTKKILAESQKAKRRFVTTDYVLDETATLLKAQGFAYLLDRFFHFLDQSKACRIEWTDAERFAASRTLFLKHADQAWSFTDCVSFQVMKEGRIRDALTKDHHFQDAGFVALLK